MVWRRSLALPHRLGCGFSLTGRHLAAVLVFCLSQACPDNYAQAAGTCTRQCKHKTTIATVGFTLPTGIVVDRHGFVYIADSGSRVRKLSPKGKVLASWGTRGSGTDQFNLPNLLTLDGSDNLYVADTGNDRVRKMSALGAPVAQWGTKGSGARQFDRPLGVAVDGHGDIYVTDASNNRVQELGPGGEPLAQWSAGLHHPAGVALDAHGKLYVADAGNNRIQKFGPSGRTLHWRSAVTLHRPTGIAVDNAGNVYVAERGSNRIRKLSPKGAVLGTWGAGGSGRTQWSFRSQNNMNGVAIDRHGDIWVADTGNNRVKQLSPTGQPLTIWE